MVRIGGGGGKCNKYFFNLEKKSYEKRHITKLKTPDGITAEDPKVILTVMKNFYNQLYTSQNQPSAERFSNFSVNESLPKLDNEKQNLCEGVEHIVLSFFSLYVYLCII